MKRLTLVSLLCLAIGACNKNNERINVTPTECLMGKWQLVGEDPNSWTFYFTEDRFYTPSLLTAGTGYHLEITDSFFTYSYYNPTYQEARWRYICNGDSMQANSVASGQPLAHFFRYNGR